MGKIQWKFITSKKDVYSHLNMEDIIEADYTDATGVCKTIKLKSLEEYYDLRV